MPQRKQAFYAGANALKLYDIESGNGTLLSGFSADASVTATESAGTQTVATDTQGDGVAHEPILLPFEGATVVASADFSGATVRFNIGVRFLDASQTVISESVGDFIASGRRSYEATVPEGTVYIQWISTRNEATATDDGEWSFNRPALRTNSAEFSH